LLGSYSAYEYLHQHHQHFQEPQPCPFLPWNSFSNINRSDKQDQPNQKKKKAKSFFKKERKYWACKSIDELDVTHVNETHSSQLAFSCISELQQ
jgi:hypothetical protein